jgi:hypothetical protein
LPDPFRGLGLLDRHVELARDVLREHVAADLLLAGIDRLGVVDHGDAGHGRADVHDHGDIALRNARIAPADQLERGLRGIGFDVHHDRLQAGGFGGGHAVLDLFLAGGRDQDFDLLLAGGGGTQDLEVQVHLVQGKRYVLVGLALDLDLHLLFPLSAGQDHLLGDHRGRGQREGDVPDAGTESLVGALDGLARSLDVGDVAVDNGVLGQRLDGVPLDAVNVTTRFRDLHHLDRGRADVAAHEGRRLGFQEFKLGG